ncbi:prolyl-tRNA synthetase associated domain-containing protein [Candidatus Roizmanbacteria bacterium]|nr:prolyl-tRNA synthetase associated domain-containing protein [Candidatus Roizmanbacteria bacterium]
MNTIYQVLSKLEIPYEKHEHPAVYTVEEALKYMRGNEGTYNKSILLRNKKGSNYYLVVTLGSKRLDLKELASFLHESKLSFSSAEKLKEYLGVTPGSVSPFGLMNDTQNVVQVIIDEDLLKFSQQGFHPNDNTATLIISTADFMKFLEWTRNKIIYLQNHQGEVI